MRSTVIALIFAMVLLAASAAHVCSNYSIFFDPVGVMLDFGGTIVVAFIIFPAREVILLYKTSLAVMRQAGDEGEKLAKKLSCSQKKLVAHQRLCREF